MPYDDPDPADPNVLVGVELSATRRSIEEMARAFAEEFAALGFGEEQILNLFRRPFYAGAHQARRVLGEAEVRRIVRESQAVWGRYRVKVQAASNEDSDPPLVQIDVELDNVSESRPEGPDPAGRNCAHTLRGARESGRYGRPAR